MINMIQFPKHPTPDIQPLTANGVGGGIHWLFEVGCWMLDVCRFRLFGLAGVFLLAGAVIAAAQSNNVPGPADYGQFSSFITARNIFNPNRSGPRPPNVRPSRPPFTPTFTLVGTMSYTKGMFAFFDGNQSELQKVLHPADTNSIAGFVVTGVTSTNVTLQSTDPKRTVPLSIGQSMQQEGGTWQLARGGEYAGRPGYDESPAPSADGSSRHTGAGLSNAGLEGNDILKRLMQRRAQEEKGN